MNGYFEKPYASVKTADGRNFVLLEPIVYHAASGDVITVPAGAQSDGASIPRMFWRLLPPFGTYWLAAYVHDYLYRQTDKPRDYCDAMFREMMEALGVPSVTVETIYEAVHFGGAEAFAGDRAQAQ